MYLFMYKLQCSVLTSVSDPLHFDTDPNHDFFCYSDPDQRFLKWIRIRSNDTDPTGSGSVSVSGSETLILTFNAM